MNEKAIQEKYIEFQFIHQQLAELQKQAQTAAQQISELEASKQSLSELAELKPGSDILVPVQNGIFVKAKLGELDSLTVNVGSGIAVVKSIDETKKILEEQQQELSNFRQQIVAELKENLTRARELEKELIDVVKG